LVGFCTLVPTCKRARGPQEKRTRYRYLYRFSDPADGRNIGAERASEEAGPSFSEKTKAKDGRGAVRSLT
jgi:hypothetical protein